MGEDVSWKAPMLGGAIAEAKAGRDEGGIPIGSFLVILLHLEGELGVFRVFQRNNREGEGVVPLQLGSTDRRPVVATQPQIIIDELLSRTFSCLMRSD